LRQLTLSIAQIACPTYIFHFLINSQRHGNSKARAAL